MFWLEDRSLYNYDEGQCTQDSASVILAKHDPFYQIFSRSSSLSPTLRVYPGVQLTISMYITIRSSVLRGLMLTCHMFALHANYQAATWDSVFSVNMIYQAPLTMAGLSKKEIWESSCVGT